MRADPPTASFWSSDEQSKLCQYCPFSSLRVRQTETPGGKYEIMKPRCDANFHSELFSPAGLHASHVLNWDTEGCTG